MDSFSPGRLTLARQRRRLNKAELAERVGVTAQSISDYERGWTLPPTEKVDRLADVLDFPHAFFYGAEPELPGASSFRAMSRMSVPQRDAALAAGALAFELAKWIDKRFTLPDPQVPNLRGFDPESAATTVREKWLMGVTPIQSMVHRLELHGIRVFSLAEQNREIDAFSSWTGAQPFCFLNTIKTVEHGRFDGAHELGHLVLHQHGAPTGRQAEVEADTFASAFLMPASSIFQHLSRNPTLDEIIRKKKIWGVSAIALAVRVHKLGLVSEWNYRRMCIELGREKEPSPMPSRETSQVLNKVFTALRSEGITKADVAAELRISLQELETLVFGLTMTKVQGNGEPSTPRPPPNLRLILSAPVLRPPPIIADDPERPWKKHLHSPPKKRT